MMKVFLRGGRYDGVTGDDVARQTDRRATKVKFSRASIRPERSRIEPDEASVECDRQRGGTPGATLPGPGTAGCASPHASDAASPLRPTRSDRGHTRAGPPVT